VLIRQLAFMICIAMHRVREREWEGGGKEFISDTVDELLIIHWERQSAGRRHHLHLRNSRWRTVEIIAAHGSESGESDISACEVR